MEIENNYEQNILSPTKLIKKDFDKKISCLICDDLKQPSDNSNLIIFECDHTFCDKCLTLKIQNRMNDINDSNYESILKCPFPECYKIMSLERMKAYLNVNLYKNLERLKTPLDLKRINSKEGEKNYESIKCERCHKDISLVNLLTLSCEHKCCKQCLLGDWENAIINKRFNYLLCPICKKDIDYQILQGNLSEYLFQKYDNFLLNKVIDDVDSQNKNIVCPKCHHLNKKYDYQKYINCSNCKYSFCSNEKCLGDWQIHYYKTCEEYKKIIELCIKCPKCQAFVNPSSISSNKGYCFQCYSGR